MCPYKALTSVNYTGTIDQWVQIDYGGEDVLTIICIGVGSPLSNGANLYINNQLVTEVNITTANSINGLAFAGCTSLTSVVIGESVTSIGAFAFVNCPALTKVVLPDTLLEVGMGAFIECANLSYSVEGDIAYLGSMVNPYLVAVGAIEESNETNEITIHSDCKIISYLAYYSSEDVYKLIVPASVTSIATGAFFDSQFVEIIVDENNEFYQSINGSLYTKDGTTLLKYVISVQDIANTVTKIEDFALCCNGDLGEIFVPESVTSIGCQFAVLELTESSTSTWRIIDYPEDYAYAAAFPLPEVVSLHDIECLMKIFGWSFRVEKN